MVHYPGFLYKLSKITKISEDNFPLLENYISDYYQLGFYYDPYPVIIPYKKQYIVAKVGGFTALRNKPLNLPVKQKIYSPYFLNLYALITSSLEIKIHPIYYYPILYPSFKRLVEALIRFQLHEYFHIIGISERGIRALRRMGISV